MPLFCRKHLNPMQRRFGLLFSTTLIATSLLFLWSYHASMHGLWKPLFSFLPAIPFLTMMFLIPRYLMREKDEFMRTLVIRALLWGFAVPMVVDTIWGFLWKLSPPDPSLPMMNVDLFCIAALFALAIQVRRYQ
ncbi:MAG: hypothetical protein WA634_12820 [Silvibacterium sp.]